MKPIIVSLCDLTGNAVRPWAEAGWACWCVDLQHGIRRAAEEQCGAGTIRYVWGDVRAWHPPEGFRAAFLMAFPPCTDVAVSGARDFAAKGLPLLCDALELFNACQRAAGWAACPYLIENPVGVLSRHIRRPDHLFNPADYAGYLPDPAAEAYTKKTCLWTGGGFVMPAPRPVAATLGSMMHLMPPSDDRVNLRSATPRGFARALYEANRGTAAERAA